MLIREVVSIEDTRDVIEKDDRFIPVPGTGITLSCEACGRDHEVHATVIFDDGSSAVVGTGCMLKQEFESHDIKHLRSKVNAAKRLPKLKAEQLKIVKAYENNAVLDEWAENTSIRDAGCTDEMIITYHDKLWARENCTKLVLGDAMIVVDGDISSDVFKGIDAVQQLTERWFELRKRERGWINPHTLFDLLARNTAKIRKATETLNTI